MITASALIQIILAVLAVSQIPHQGDKQTDKAQNVLLQCSATLLDLSLPPSVGDPFHCSYCKHTVDGYIKMRMQFVNHGSLFNIYYDH